VLLELGVIAAKLPEDAAASSVVGATWRVAAWGSSDCTGLRVTTTVIVTEWDRVPLLPVMVTVKVVGESGLISGSKLHLAVLVPPGMTRTLRGLQ